MSDIVLEVNNLKKYFKTSGGLLHAVDGASFSIDRGKTLGVVGESGSGKSTLGRVILRLLVATEGSVFFDGEDILKADAKRIRQIRQDMQIIFQDPYESINPRMRIGEIISEPFIVHKLLKDKSAIEVKVLELMETVGLANRLINAYPHELDGGRRQRIGIARALATNPKFIVCDEPVSALDVSIQAQILNLMQDLQDEMGFTYLFITHNLSVVKHLSDDIIVMYLGQVVEKAPKEDLFVNPLHPYTRALLAAIPIPKLSSRGRKREIIKGEIKSVIDPKPGCRFADRCQYVIDKCIDADPEFREVSPGHFVSCIRV